jgi:GT2 family glycosyltransferase
MTAAPTPQHPRVDVVILSWNRTDDTLKAIDSALAQRDVDVRVYLVDQGSSAEHLARMRAFLAERPQAIMQELGRNVGAAEGRNLATAMGGAPLVVGLDNDATFADRHVLARTASRFAEDPRLGVIAMRVFEVSRNKDDMRDFPAPYQVDPPREFETTRFIGAGYAVRRDVFERAGGFDPLIFIYGEERDLAWRILNLGYKIVWCKDLAVDHHIGATRTNWGDLRYVMTVRNALYTNWKYGWSWPRLAMGAAAFVVRGTRNGVGGRAVKGALAAIGLARSFQKSGADRTLYRLSAETRALIDRLDQVHHEPVLTKIRRQFTHLPQN